MTMAAATAVPGDAQPRAKIFISYSRKDMAFADCLDAALRARRFEPLIDRAEIYAFEDWWKRVETLITQADTIIFVLSPDSVSSEICAKEVALAVSLHKRFAPIVCKRVDDRAVPETLRRLNFIFCDDDALFDARMDQLAEALSIDIAWIRKHTEFGAMARRWEAAGLPAPRGLLLRSPMLEEAEQWLTFRPHGAPDPTQTTRLFISESRKNEDALVAEAKVAQKRKRRLELTLVALLIVISLAGIAYAIWTNFDYLRARGEMIADVLWPKKLPAETERGYAQMILLPGQIITFRECTRCPEMVVVPKGEFMMGSPESETGREAIEGPQHKVTIAGNFAVGKFEVMFDEWQACVAVNVCEGTSDNRRLRVTRPVVTVSWDNAQQYVRWLSERVGKPGSYRLLTEAEWEYAARAGSTTAYSWGDEIKNDGKTMANCSGCGSQWDAKQTAPVGSFTANAFGLYDMHGNVLEWVEDCVSANYNNAPTDGSPRIDSNCSFRIVRGGSWLNGPLFLRSAYRLRYSSVSRGNGIGFRVGRTLAP